MAAPKAQPPIENPLRRDNRTAAPIQRSCFRRIPLTRQSAHECAGPFDAFDLNKYGVGQPVRRTEDPVLVQGQGRYTDDFNLPGQAYAVFVRSRNGHGVIKKIDTAAAKGMPGVLGDLHRRGSRRLRHHEMRRAVQEPRRLAR